MSDTTEAHKKPKPRSPSYPSISLGRAVERATAIYEHEGKYFAPVTTILAHWGYNAIGGRALRQLAALKKFGLIEDEGSRESRKIKLSELGLDIVMPDSPKREAALRIAALKPAIHQELRAQFPDGLPSAQNVRYYLFRERGFTERAAAELLEEYRATLEFAGLDSASGSRDTVEDDDDETDVDAEDTEDDMTVLDEEMGSTEDRGKERGAGTTMRLPLRDGSVVRFSMPTGMTEAEWEQWMTVLGALKPSHVPQGS